MRTADVIYDNLSRLNGILDQLADPEGLSGEDVGRLVAEWEVDMARLEAHTARFPEGVTAGDGTKERILRFVNRIAEVQPILMRHKSAIADQLFSENRRVQSLQRGYGAMMSGSSLFRHKA